MKRIVPSTKGSLSVTVSRTGRPEPISESWNCVRFGAVRGIVNGMLSRWDDSDYPIRLMSIKFTTAGDRSRGGGTAA